jgi:hypothetical protein
MKRLLIVAALILAGAGCAAAPSPSPAQPPASEDGPSAPAAKRPPAAKPEDSIFIIDGAPVGLADGLASEAAAPGSEAVVVTRIFGAPVAADLDGDGDEDAAVVLSRETPGSGTFYYAAASIKEDWGYRGTEARLLGDRIAPQALEARDGVVIANYAERKPGEPMTEAPSVGVSRYYILFGGELQETEPPAQP